MSCKLQLAAKLQNNVAENICTCPAELDLTGTLVQHCIPHFVLQKCLSSVNREGSELLHVLMKMKRDAGLGSLWPPDWPMGTFLEAVVAMVRRRAQFTKVTNGAHLQSKSMSDVPEAQDRRLQVLLVVACPR